MKWMFYPNRLIDQRARTRNDEIDPVADQIDEIWNSSFCCLEEVQSKYIYQTFFVMNKLIFNFVTYAPNSDSIFVTTCLECLKIHLLNDQSFRHRFTQN